MHSNKAISLLSNRIVQNGIWLYILQIFNTLIPLFTIPYITRILGANEYGVFSIAFNLIGYIMVIVEYGFNMSGARKASLTSIVSELDSTFTAILLSRLLLCIISFGLITVYSLVVNNSQEQKICLLILFLIPFGMVFQQNWLFQGLQKMHFITITSVIARSLSLVGIFVFVKSPNDLPLYCLFYACTNLITGIIGTVFAYLYIGVRFIRISFGDIIDELKSGWYVFTTSFSSKVFNAFGITVLGIMATEYDVGIYSAIQKIPQALLLAWSPISQVLYPVMSSKISESYKKGRAYLLRIEKYILMIFGAIFILICIFSKPIVRLAFGQEYISFHYLVIPLLIWLFIGIINNFSGVLTLLAGGYSKEYSRCFMLGVLFTIVLSLIFIKLWGIIGCAFAPLISEAIFGLLLYYTVHKIDRESV